MMVGERNAAHGPAPLLEVAALTKHFGKEAVYA